MTFRENIKDFYNKKHTREYGTEGVYLSPDPEHYHHKILNRLKSNQVILDVGCATGYLGAVAKKSGNRVYGIEISETAADKATRILDSVIVGNVEEIELPYPVESFDVIICSDIVEHLFDPQGVLVKLRQYLKQDGQLMVAVPNIAHYTVRWMLLRGKWQYSGIGCMDYGHLRFFNKQTMAELLRASGYSVREIIPWINLPPRISYVDSKFLNKRLTKFCSHTGVFDTFLALVFLYISEVN